MREIKFRGKRIDNGEWVCGVPVVTSISGAYMVSAKAKSKGGKGGIVVRDVVVQHEVDPATIGQYTGLKDKNGTEIYEGDVLKSVTYRYVGEVKYVPENAAFLVFWSDDKGRHAGYLDDGMCSRIEVIGNIHDNPDY